MARSKRSGDARITPARAKNLIAVAKVVGPAVIPVVAPLAVRAAGLVSERYDRFRARRLGVDVGELPEYTGKGAKLSARLAGVAGSLTELRERSDLGDADRAWVSRTEGRLAQLAAAVRAAERMPAARRKAAHRAVSADLDQIEAELLRHLGVS
jgi:hypothetical protein